MAREQLVRRFYGSEIEYGYTPDLNNIGKNNYPPQLRERSNFLSNGGKMYIDGDLIEYATPECNNLDELITHEIAGERLVWDAYGNGRSEIETLHKRTSDVERELTFGAHENYSTVDLIWGNSKIERSNRRSLAAHFATRTIFTGAGQPTDRGYALAQKMYDISTMAGQQSLENKALVDTRDEPNAGNTNLRRLHVISGDANMSPWATRMKYGTTSLVLRLLEHGADLEDLHLSREVQAARSVAGKIEGIKKPLLLRTGERSSALDIQESFAERAEQLSQRIELPLEEQQVIVDWISTIDALRRFSKTGDHQSELLQIDWYAKKQLLDRDREKKGEITRDRENAIDLVYDQLPNGAGARLRKNDAWFAPHMPPEDKIQHAKTIPPEGRAKLRAAFVEKASTLRINSYLPINWDGAHFYTTDKTRKAIMDLPIDGEYPDKEIAKRVKIFAREAKNYIKNIS